MNPTYEERKEIVQDVIDRIIYLNDKEKAEFLNYMRNMFRAYPLKNVKINGASRTYQSVRHGQ